MVGEFVFWLEDAGIFLTDRGGRRVLIPTKELLAKFFGIDVNRLEREKLAMLEDLNRQSVEHDRPSQGSKRPPRPVLRIADQSQWTECVCQNCGRRQAVQDFDANKSDQCFACGSVMLVPSAHKCQEDRDNGCRAVGDECPQHRDGEPEKTGRWCPLLKNSQEDDE